MVFFQRTAKGDVRVRGNDYHWYRQDIDGLWSHKPGFGNIMNVDGAGKPITDPAAAINNHETNYPGYTIKTNYSNQGGYLWVPPNLVF